MRAPGVFHTVATFFPLCGKTAKQFSIVLKTLRIQCKLTLFIKSVNLPDGPEKTPAAGATGAQEPGA
jgi:hypothetical protein